MTRKSTVWGFIVLLVAIPAPFLIWFFLHLDRPAPSSPPLSFPQTNLAGRSLTVLTNQPHLRAAQALAEWFQEETGAVVRNIVVDYADTLHYTFEDTASTNPRLDIIMFWYVELGALVEGNVLVDITDFIEENHDTIRPADYIPSIYDPYTLYKGRRWGLPYDGDTHVLFYRKSLLEKYGLHPPNTWDEFAENAQIITENEKHNGIYGTAIMAPQVPVIILSSFMNRLGCYGGKLLDDNGRPALASDQAVHALTAMVEHCRYALPTPLETDWEVSRDAFLSGRVAMVEQWTDIGVMSEDPARSLIKGDWGCVQMPRGDGEGACHAAALNSGYCLGISRRAPDPEAARAYLLFVARPDITLHLNLIDGGIDPTRTSVFSSPAYREIAPGLSESVQKAIEHATPWPTIPETPKLLEILRDSIVRALVGRDSPRQALEYAQAQWCEVLHLDD